MNDDTNPFYVVVSPDGQVLGTTGGYREPDVFVDFLTRCSTSWMAKAQGKVARRTVDDRHESQQR